MEFRGHHTHPFRPTTSECLEKLSCKTGEPAVTPEPLAGTLCSTCAGPARYRENGHIPERNQPKPAIIKSTGPHETLPEDIYRGQCSFIHEQHNP